jgi:hypothetical protein
MFVFLISYIPTPPFSSSYFYISWSRGGFTTGAAALVAAQ